MRGRVMALWALAWLGSTPIGGPVVGWVGQVIGPRWALVIGGLPTVVCGILALPALTRIDRRAAQSAGPAEAAGAGGSRGPAQAEAQLTAHPR
jgi:MFS family permease